MGKRKQPEIKRYTYRGFSFTLDPWDTRPIEYSIAAYDDTYDFDHGSINVSGRPYREAIKECTMFADDLRSDAEYEAAMNTPEQDW